MRADVKVQSRVLKAFRMMLDFYGMELVDEKRGHIRRNANNWKLRYAHLNRLFFVMFNYISIVPNSYINEEKIIII